MSAYTAPDDFYTDVQVATMLALHPVTVRKWRTKNTAAGCIKYGPPYEYHGANVVYPRRAFSDWCGKVVVVNGVARMNLAVKTPVALPSPLVAA